MGYMLPFSAALDYLLRKTKGGTQKQIATATGLKQPQVSMLKTAERQGTEEQRRAIAFFFNLNYESFIKLGTLILDGYDPIPREAGSKLSPERAVEIIQTFLADTSNYDKWIKSDNLHLWAEEHPAGSLESEEKGSSPHHLDPAIQLVNEAARKKGIKLTPDQARAYADGIREKYFSDDVEESENVTHNTKFKNEELAGEIIEKLAELESLSSIEFARLAIDITDRIESIKQNKAASDK